MTSLLILSSLVYWSSKNWGFPDGLVTQPEKINYSKAKRHSLRYQRIKWPKT